MNNSSKPIADNRTSAKKIAVINFGSNPDEIYRRISAIAPITGDSNLPVIAVGLVIISHVANTGQLPDIPSWSTTESFDFCLKGLLSNGTIIKGDSCYQLSDKCPFLFSKDGVSASKIGGRL